MKLVASFTPSSSLVAINTPPPHSPPPCLSPTALGYTTSQSSVKPLSSLPAESRTQRDQLPPLALHPTADTTKKKTT